ncbi:hypothetical protein L1887_17963 [Cichorium endivia]|nr:hypothetical protein L1887_17963 [Cichorium endivia]
MGSYQGLKVSNLYNMIDSELSLNGLISVVANLSTNGFSSENGSSSDGCPKLEYVDMSSNFLTESLSFGVHRFKEFAVCENRLNNELHTSVFSESYSLEALDLSKNTLTGKIPTAISSCNNLTIFDSFSLPVRFQRLYWVCRSRSSWI